MRKNFGRGKRDPRFFLDRIQDFLHRLGNPEKGFKYVHITGTAGKGSVSNLVHDMLTAEGKQSGLFTSPYVTTTVEKIKVGEKYISPKEFVALVNDLKPFIREAEKSGPFGAPSAFELFLAIALLYYRQKKCEWVVLEVGLGGRYDATNVIPNPVITAITNIDYDHTELLGKTLKAIATDKSGIIKKDSLFFTSEQRPSIVSLLKKVCHDQGAVFHHIEKQKDYRQYNQILATRIAQVIGLSSQAIEKAIQNQRLPCRFEIMETKPRIILDGAHNRAKIKSTINNLKKYPHKKLIVLMALSDTKPDRLAIIEPLLAVADTLIVTGVKTTTRISVHPKVLMAEIGKHKKVKAKIRMIPDMHKALATARKQARPNDCILVTGSFFLAGELRQVWFSEKWVLEHQRSF